jgi:acyl-ACP thioesterase
VTGTATVRDPDTCSSTYRVRFDEAAPDGRIRTSVLLRYTQDLAGLHSSSRGFGRDWYAERGLTWLVRAAEVAVLAPIEVNVELVATTRVIGWRRVWARRRTDFVDDAGTPLASVLIDWVLLDARGSPTRIPSEFDAVFGAPAATFGLARVDLGEPAADATRTSLDVRPQELDPLVHVNNAVYADWLDEAVLADGGPRGEAAVRAIPRLARLEYVRAVEPGTRPEVAVWPAAGGWSCLVSSDEGAARVDHLRARLEPPAGATG